ncbi:MAG: hypothetical protein NTZ07_01830, partial [Candidatus Woesebacteria bacterium]|nr:hypothetical protein [Candidatus Woesebacteria bacterium]
MNPQAKLSVCIFSDANFLALNILENLLSRNCFINIITEDVNNWRDKTMHLSIKSKFNILDIKNFAFDNHYDYAIFCGGFVNSTEAYAEYTGFISLPDINAAKTVVIFPFDVFDRDQVDRIKISNNTAVLFLGDLLGPRIDLDSDLLIARSLSEMLWKRKLTLAVGETFYPIFIADAVRLIIKWLFSFGPYGKVVFVLGSQVSGDTFWSDNQKLIGKLEPKYDTGRSARIIPKGFETEVINSNLGFSLAETYNWLKNNLTSRPTLSEKKNETKK